MIFHLFILSKRVKKRNIFFHARKISKFKFRLLNLLTINASNISHFIFMDVALAIDQSPRNRELENISSSVCWVLCECVRVSQKLLLPLFEVPDVLD